MAEAQVPFLSSTHNSTRRTLSPSPSYRSRPVSPIAHEIAIENNSSGGLASLSDLETRPPIVAPTTVKSPVFVDASSDDTYIEGWPAEPQRLRQRGTMFVLITLGDCIITIAPVYFIVLGILAFRLNDQPTLNNSLGKNVQEMSKLGPTMFPIVFTAVAGRSMKTVARFCAERGMNIGVLELLLASQTVWGTFESQILLRRFTVIGAHLFILWSLSPLGGQASLRLIHTGASSANSTSLIRYLPTIGMSDLQTNSGVFASGDTDSALSVTNSLYNGNLLAPELVKMSSQDTWGNLKIPRLTTVQNVTKSEDGWATVPALSSPDNFTAIVGLPIVGSSTDSTSTKRFSLDYSYMDMDCSQEWFISTPTGNWTTFLGAVWSSTNGSGIFYNDVTGDQTSFFLDTNLPYDGERVTQAYFDQNSSTQQDPVLQIRRNILFGSEYYGPAVNTKRGYSIFLRNCTVWTEFLEAQVECHSQDCEVSAIRPSVKFANRNHNLTPLDFSETSHYLFKNLPIATGSVHDADAEPSELFVRGLNTPFASYNSIVSDMTAISSQDFASRLVLLLNTYYQISLSPMSFVGNLPGLNDESWDAESTSAYQMNLQTDPTNVLAPFMPMNTTALVTKTTEVYTCDYFWFAFLLVSSSVLLLTGLVSTILKYKCLAPDMMGFVTSLTYNNPHVNLPPGGGVLSAMERARLLRDVEVKIGDANEKGDIGRVVFATTNGETPIGRLQKCKTYL